MRKTIATTFLALTGFIAASAPTYAEWSANVGYASEYFYRGIYQDESSASAGIDFEANGFNLGTWVADVGDGVETDVYGGYTFGGDDWSLGLGFTGYYYSDDFDDTYEEVNFRKGGGIRKESPKMFYPLFRSTNRSQNPYLEQFFQSHSHLLQALFDYLFQR